MSASAAIVLAADTATSWLTVGVGGDGGCLAERSLERGARPRRTLIELVEAVLAEAGLERARLGGLAVGIGPGSFTGVRIGISSFQGIALATGLPLVGISTLESVAHGAWAAGAIDAREHELFVVSEQGHGEVAVARFRLQSPGPPVLAGEPLGGTPERALEGMPEGALLVGDGRSRHGGALAGALPRGVRWLDDALAAPRGGVVAALGAARLAAATAPPEPLSAIYVRPHDALRRA